jgi:hypothetical protein
MEPETADDELLIEDISPEMLQQIEARAKAHVRTVEREALVLLAIGLQLSENDQPESSTA